MGHVNGRGIFSTHHSSETPQPIVKINLRNVYPILCKPSPVTVAAVDVRLSRNSVVVAITDLVLNNCSLPPFTLSRRCHTSTLRRQRERDSCASCRPTIPRSVVPETSRSCIRNRTVTIQKGLKADLTRIGIAETFRLTTRLFCSCE